MKQKNAKMFFITLLSCIVQSQHCLAAEVKPQLDMFANVLGLTINQENPYTDYRTGDALWLSAAVSF
jgi:hypothetical protein